MSIKTKMTLFYNNEHKNKTKFFSHNNLKFQPRS